MEVGHEPVQADFGRVILEEVTVTDDMIHRRTQFVLQLLEILGIADCTLVEVGRDQFQQSLAPGMNVSEILVELWRQSLFFQHHFAITNNVVDRGTQFVTRLRKIVGGVAHGGG